MVSEIQFYCMLLPHHHETTNSSEVDNSDLKRTSEINHTSKVLSCLCGILPQLTAALGEQLDPGARDGSECPREAGVAMKMKLCAHYHANTHESFKRQNSSLALLD